MEAAALGLGLDLVEIDRLEQALERRGERLLLRLFTDAERAYCSQRKRPGQHFAARFAAKEAGFKALGTGWGDGVGWRDVEVINQSSGRPTLALHGRAAEVAAGRGWTVAEVSLTHAGNYAGATVLLMRAEIG
ncbi:MAG TPA: holo-ACP synthase [Acidobacteriota bacterium]